MSMRLSCRALSTVSIPAFLLATGVRSLSSMPSTVIPPETREAIEGLSPKPLWSHFAALSSIPRPSKQEDAVLNYIRQIADEHNLSCKTDTTGNLCVFKPGANGGQEAPPVILQGHVDMVTEQNQGTNHDFQVDPIRLRKISLDSSSWIGAHGTTLGADNGIGVAAVLAVLTQNDKPTPPIQALFTVDEETGLTGAMKLDTQALGLTGRTMLNLDTEEWGDLYVGCSGGGSTTIQQTFQRCPLVQETSQMELRVDGLMGGHSGINIHEGRANAIVLCALTVHKLVRELNVRLESIQGGDKHNAIPREACARIFVHEEDKERVRELVHQCQQDFLKEYGTLESNLRITIQDHSETTFQDPLDVASTQRLLGLLLALPVGPIKYSHVIPDLVETSNNLASVVCQKSEHSMLCSTRSSMSSALEATRDRIEAIATMAMSTSTRSSSYPGWNPNPDSEILGLAKTLLEPRLKRQPGVKAIHAGLECGLLLEKLGTDQRQQSVDAISFGPTITGAHSPDERVNADTVLPFYELLEDILAELARRKA